MLLVPPVGITKKQEYSDATELSRFSQQDLIGEQNDIKYKMNRRLARKELQTEEACYANMPVK